MCDVDSYFLTLSNPEHIMEIYSCLFKKGLKWRKTTLYFN